MKWSIVTRMRHNCGKNKAAYLRHPSVAAVSQGYRGIAGLTQNGRKMIQYKFFRPKMDGKCYPRPTLRHLCDTSATPRCRRKLAACINNSRSFIGVKNILRHFFKIFWYKRNFFKNYFIGIAVVNYGKIKAKQC